MLIIGAKGFAKEILEICHQNHFLENLVFYDDVNEDVSGKLYDKFPILKSPEEALYYLKNFDSQYTIGVGNPLLRKKLFDRFTNYNGILTSTISKKTSIGSYNVFIGAGTNILDGVKISNDVKIGKASIIYYNSIITHDVTIGDFVEISPGASLLGRCKIGNFSKIGAGAIIFPDVEIGENVTIGAGAVVRHNINSNSTAVGVPAKVIKQEK